MSDIYIEEEKFEKIDFSKENLTNGEYEYCKKLNFQ
jgi:hypothetical protein